MKNSFEPISFPEINILILGSLPGDKSLELNEYYGHQRNRFWKIISTITNNENPKNYLEKLALLQKTNIGVWDVVQQAERIGSLDTAIKNELPNDLNSFIEKHKALKIIAFNGKKAMALYDRYFEKNNTIEYQLLPSSSPANAGIGFEALCTVWKKALKINEA